MKKRKIAVPRLPMEAVLKLRKHKTLGCKKKQMSRESCRQYRRDRYEYQESA